MSESYDTQHRIPQRRSGVSATPPDTVAPRQTPSGNALLSSTHTRRHTKDDVDVSSRSPMQPLVRRLDRAPLTVASPLPRYYRIPLADGTLLQVTQRQLADLPEDYQTAAQLVPPPRAAPRLSSQPQPKLSVQDTTVDVVPLANTHPRGTNAAALPRRRRRRFPRLHGLVWVGIALFMMVAGTMLLNMVARWWQVTQDDMRYGRPRTFQVDANVGHGTAANPDSHFIALNLHGHIEVIEIAGDDPAHAKMYIGPTLIGQGEELAPVTLSFEDVNHDRRPDLIIHIGDSKVIFLNQRDGTFKPAPTQQ